MNSTLKKFLFRIGALGVIALFLYFSFYYQFRGSLYFYTDLGRDFLLLQDLVVKKVTFIGARTSLQGIFHGPLWLYVNLPAFSAFHGNPVLVSWYWMALTLLFLISIFIVTLKIFDETSAWIATCLMAANMIWLSEFFTNPIGALFVMPLFLFFMVRYLQTRKVWYLILHLLIGGVLVQFEMMVGVPLLVLSLLVCLFIWKKYKKTVHVLAWTVLVVPLSSFVIFDIRHQFLQLHSLWDYVTGRIDQFPSHKPFSTILTQKVDLISHTDLGVFVFGKFESLNVLTLMSFVSVFAQEKVRKIKAFRVFCLFAFYFLGFFLLTFVLKDTLLNHYFYPLMVIPIMVFAALHQRINKWLFGATLVLALLTGVVVGNDYAYTVRNRQTSSENDWQLLSAAASVPFRDNEPAFGYFVYAPDIYAYQQKYAMSYEMSLFPQLKVSPYHKEQVTYLLVASPSLSKLEMSAPDWIRLKLHIDPKIKPKKSWMLPGGYTVLKYVLSPEESQIGVDFDINDSVFFR